MTDSHIHDLQTLDPRIQDLVKEALEVRKLAYSPYSNFQVGAALLCDDGTTSFSGCNVENGSYTCGTCAERCAYFKAISEGHQKFKALVVAAYQENAYTSPCGACRQFICEFNKIDVYLVKPDLDQVFVTDSDELLPFHFEFKLK